MFKQKKGVEVFKRRISDEIVKMASCVLMAYLVLTLIVSLIICQLENISYITVLFSGVSTYKAVKIALFSCATAAAILITSGLEVDEERHSRICSC